MKSICLLALLLTGCAAHKPVKAANAAYCEPAGFTADALREPTIVICRWPDGRIRIWKWQQ